MDTNFVSNGNKLIAEFMGYEYIPYVKEQTQSPGWWHKKSPNIIKGKIPSATKLSRDYFLCRRHGELRYYNEWNWLMDVVEKIEEMAVVASFQIDQPTIYIWASSENSTFEDIEVDILGRSKLQAVYEACIKFIKWYNEK